MDGNSETFIRKPIVVGVDGSTFALKAAAWAAAEADRRGSQLHVLMCLDTQRTDATSEDQRVLRDAGVVVGDISPSIPVTLQVRPGIPAPTLIDMSAQAGLIVLGTTGSGSSSGTLPGRTALTVATWSHCPVVIVRKSAPAVGAPANPLIVSVVDGSAASAIPLALAFEEAALHGAELLILVEPRSHRDDRLPDWLDLGGDGHLAVLDALRVRYPHVPLSFELMDGRRVESFIAAGAAAKLIVLGTHSSDGLTPLLVGTSLDWMLCEVGCPLLIAPTRALLNPRPAPSSAHRGQPSLVRA